MLDIFKRKKDYNLNLNRVLIIEVVRTSGD